MRRFWIAALAVAAWLPAPGLGLPHGDQSETSQDSGAGAGVAALTDEELVKIAEDFSEKEFKRRLINYDLEKFFIASQPPPQSSSLKARQEGQVTDLVIESKTGVPTFSAIRSSIDNFEPDSMKGLKKMMMAGGFARWVKNMVNVYSTNSTDVERVVVATSIIPFMRCAFDASAKAEKGKESVDSRFALCTAMDLVSLTPAWPLAAAVTITLDLEWERLMVPENLNQRRADNWALQRRLIITDLVSGECKARVRTQYAAMQVSTLFEECRVKGTLYAGTLQAAATEEERQRIRETEDFEGKAEVEQKTCEAMSQLRTQLVEQTLEESTKLLKTRRFEFDELFFKNHVAWMMENRPRGLGAFR
ncbi:hypothetical protein ACCO45_013024 [Purpureocillium lilacinum]|uniref:Uncharacterized protein n=1 Tax=Purpureocillium lilacinum TaxID=33203 RepID=A0ACC4DC72_PURLI